MILFSSYFTTYKTTVKKQKRDIPNISNNIQHSIIEDEDLQSSIKNLKNFKTMDIEMSSQDLNISFQSLH